MLDGISNVANILAGVVAVGIALFQAYLSYPLVVETWKRREVNKIVKESERLPGSGNAKVIAVWYAGREMGKYRFVSLNDLTKYAS